jgi:hypothetical protein
MAKAKSTQATEKKVKIKVSRPGVHAKKSSSKLKSSKNYKKSYVGQGKRR